MSFDRPKNYLYLFAIVALIFVFAITGTATLRYFLGLSDLSVQILFAILFILPLAIFFKKDMTRNLKLIWVFGIIGLLTVLSYLFHF